MGEVLQEAAEEEKVWTAERCQEFLILYEIGRQLQKKGHDYLRFMEAHAGTFPREVVQYVLDNNVNATLPAGELARHFPGSPPVKIVGVEIASIND